MKPIDQIIKERDEAQQKINEIIRDFVKNTWPAKMEVEIKKANVEIGHTIVYSYQVEIKLSI